MRYCCFFLSGRLSIPLPRTQSFYSTPHRFIILIFAPFIIGEKFHWQRSDNHHLLHWRDEPLFRRQARTQRLLGKFRRARFRYFSRPVYHAASPPAALRNELCHSRNLRKFLSRSFDLPSGIGCFRRLTLPDGLAGFGTRHLPDRSFVYSVY